MQSPSEIHLRSVKRVLRYIQGTLDLGILYSRGTIQLIGYSDADWAGSDEEMRSISGCCFTLGSGVITWFSKKQTVVAQSTAEAEYVALAKCGNQAVWLRKVMADLMVPQTSLIGFISIASAQTACRSDKCTAGSISQGVKRETTENSKQNISTE